MTISSHSSRIIISDDDDDFVQPKPTKRHRSFHHISSSEEEKDIKSPLPLPSKRPKSSSSTPASKPKWSASKVKDIKPSEYFSSSTKKVLSLSKQQSPIPSTLPNTTPKPVPQVVDLMDVDSDTLVSPSNTTPNPILLTATTLASTTPTSSLSSKKPHPTPSVVSSPHYKDAFNSNLQSYMTQPNPVQSAHSSASGGGDPASNPNEIPEGKENCLHGLTFVVSGDFDLFGDRKDLENYIKKYGGRVTGAVSGKTSYLIVGESPGANKSAKAKSLGTPIIALQEMFHMVRTRGAVNDDQVEKSKPASQAKRDLVVSALPSPSPTSDMSALWTDKYRPTKSSEIIGNKGLVEKLTTWLLQYASARKAGYPDTGDKHFTQYKAVLISGLPGKTTAAHIIAKEAGYSVLEFNASDIRSKKSIDEIIMPVIDNHTLFDMGNTSKTAHDHVIIMDEVDGMSGADRQGLAELVVMIKKSRVPIICICNDRSSPKMKTLTTKCLELRFIRPDAKAIRSRLMSICHREGLTVQPNAIDLLVQSTRSDIRQIIQLLSTYRLCSQSLEFNTAQAFGHHSEKDATVGMFDAIQQLLSPMFVRHATMRTMMDAYFADYDMVPLMMQENYVHVNASKDSMEELTRLSAAADAIAMGDQIHTVLRGQQQWSLLNAHAVFSTVKPAFVMCTGTTCSGSHQQHRFTSALGKLSTYNMNQRIMTGLDKRVGLGGGSATTPGLTALRTDYIPLLTMVIHRLWTIGDTRQMIALMDAYYLNRDDLDDMYKLLVGHMNGSVLLRSIPAKDKSAFTRMYNALKHPVFSVLIGAAKRGGGGSRVAELDGDAEESGGSDLDDGVEDEALTKQFAAKASTARQKAGSSARKRPAKK